MVIIKNKSKIISFIMFFAIFFIIVFGMVKTIIFKDEYPFIYKPALIMSNSMEPTFSIDDLVIVKKANNISIGDIIVFTDINGNKIIHRVVEINENIITRGDANNTNDAPITMKDVSGVFVCKIKYLGKIIKLLKTPVGTIMTLLFILLIVFLPNRTHVKVIRKYNILKIIVISICLLLLVWTISEYYSKYSSSINSNESIATVASLYLGKTQRLQVDSSSLKPGSTMKYRFGVKNSDGNRRLEVTMNYSIEIKSSDNLPLNYSLKCINKTNGTCIYENSYSAINTNTKINGGIMPLTDSAHTYELTINWPQEVSNADYANELEIITIDIDFVQKD